MPPCSCLLDAILQNLTVIVASIAIFEKRTLLKMSRATFWLLHFSDRQILSSRFTRFKFRCCRCAVQQHLQSTAVSSSITQIIHFSEKRTLLKIQNAVCSALCFFIWDFPSGRFARFQLRCRRVLPSVAMSSHVSFMVVSSSIMKIIGHFGKRNFVEQLTGNVVINSII